MLIAILIMIIIIITALMWAFAFSIRGLYWSNLIHDMYKGNWLHFPMSCIFKQEFQNIQVAEIMTLMRKSLKESFVPRVRKLWFPSRFSTKQRLN